jgi:tripartite-type tricarboxylate transporter receptor subunit TctC
MKLKTIVVSLTIALAMAGSPFAAAAEWKPSKPLRLQIGFGAGGETDTIGRVIASVLKSQTGWNVIAENKPGGGGVAMFAGIAKGSADGTTIGLGVNMPIMINLVLRGKKLPFKLDSFAYLATVSRIQVGVIAKKDAPFDNIKQLAAHSKKAGGVPVAFDAKPQELLMRYVNKADGADFKLVSTKSSAEMIQLVLGGQVAASFSAGKHIPYIEKGTLKLLASANDGRHTYAPDVPTFREQGYNAFVDPIFYFAAKKGIPAAAKAALVEALKNAIASPEVEKIVTNTLSTKPLNMGPDGTHKMLVDGMASVKVLFAK